MTSILRLPRWSPYAVGIAIGVLSWITFAFMQKALGTSTAMVNATAGLERLVLPEHVDQNAYLAKHVGTAAAPKPVIEWQFALVVMLAFGSFLAARLAGPKVRDAVPAIWRQRFGGSFGKRAAAAFVGGVILLFGARLADGCTSGHGISGGLQLAVSSWLFIPAMLASGIATAYVLFGRGGQYDAR